MFSILKQLTKLTVTVTDWCKTESYWRFDIPVTNCYVYTHPVIILTGFQISFPRTTRLAV